MRSDRIRNCNIGEVDLNLGVLRWEIIKSYTEVSQMNRMSTLLHEFYVRSGMRIFFRRLRVLRLC